MLVGPASFAPEPVCAPIRIAELKNKNITIIRRIHTSIFLPFNSAAR
jgi:hypothetical protein